MCTDCGVRIVKKTIDEATARKLCAGCVYRKDLNPRCMKCFVQVLGQWRALAREAEEQREKAPLPGSAGKGQGDRWRREA